MDEYYAERGWDADGGPDGRSCSRGSASAERLEARGVEVKVVLFGHLARLLPAGSSGNSVILSVKEGATIGEVLDDVGVPVEGRSYVHGERERASRARRSCTRPTSCESSCRSVGADVRGHRTFGQESLR